MVDIDKEKEDLKLLKQMFPSAEEFFEDIYKNSKESIQLTI